MSKLYLEGEGMSTDDVSSPEPPHLQVVFKIK